MQAITTLLARGVFLLSVITILGSGKQEIVATLLIMSWGKVSVWTGWIMKGHGHDHQFWQINSRLGSIVHTHTPPRSIKIWNTKLLVLKTILFLKPSQISRPYLPPQPQSRDTCGGRISPGNILLKSTLPELLGTYFVSPFCYFHNLLNIRISSKVGSRENQFSINFNLAGVLNEKYENLSLVILI